MSKKASPDQGELLIVSDRAGAMQPINPEQPPASVNRIEQKLHLVNALVDLAGASMRDGLARMDQGQLSERYKEQTSVVIKGAKQKRVELLASAQESFKKGSGYYALVASGIKPPGGLWHFQNRLYSPFLVQYYGMRKHPALHAYRNKLIKEIGELQGWTRPEQFEPTVSDFNRENTRRPHKDKTTKKRVEESADRELEKLTTIDKLEAVEGDPRAQFIPKTHHAKNVVTGWLDYLDNPSRPRGINDQLIEIYIHNQTKLGHLPSEAARAMETITWEIGDHAVDAYKSLAHILDLKKEVAECLAPHVSLAEEFPNGHPGLLVWARHRALRELMTTGSIAGMTSPMAVLRTSTDPPPSKRRLHGTAPGKHKTLLNQFTRPDIKRKYAKYVNDLTEKTKIGQVRGDFDEIVADLTNEFSFFRTRLNDIANIGDGTRNNPRFQPAQKAAQEILIQLQQLYTVA